MNLGTPRTDPLATLGMRRGTLFAAPCLQALPKEYVDKLAPAEGGPKLRKEEQQAKASA